MLSRNDFLALVLPPLQDGEHYYTLSIKNTQDKPVTHQQFVSDIDDISAQADVHVKDVANSFFALAKYGPTNAGRTTGNALALKAFYIDLDCGPGKPFPDLSAGLLALRDFCKAAKLPKPTIVKSGTGAHLYWVMDTPMERKVWKGHADKLRELCKKHGFTVDPAVTGDAARVLRIPGTMHVKDSANPIPVEIIHVAPVIPHNTIAELLPPDAEALSVLDSATFHPMMDAATKALLGNSQSRFKTILIKSVEGSGCNQILQIYTHQETVLEPLWRAGLSIAQHCIDRDKAIHRISCKHPYYNPYDADHKASQTKGPYTCRAFRELNPDGCEGCKLKLTSPIQLGREIIEATEKDRTVAVEEKETKETKILVIPKFPYPFMRGKNGGIYQRVKDDNGNFSDELVYPLDFYVTKRMHDNELGEVLLMRLHLPKDGIREFRLPLAHVMSKEKFVTSIASQGVTVLGKKQDALMFYVTKWVEELQAAEQADQSRRQFGWLEDKSAIVVGEREIRAADVMYNPPSSATMALCAALQPKGDFHVWKDVINTYGRPGMEARAFAFFTGFGTLLMKFASLDGFLLNLISPESGVGKTMVQYAINSIYGRPKELIMSPNDTVNARWQRLGTMQNLAVTMDEITNMLPEQLSQLAYDGTSGRARHRLKHYDNAERPNETKWQTGIVSSSNRATSDALFALKTLPDGEMKRILEVSIPPDAKNDPVWARHHFDRLFTNYGHAIQPYAQALVAQAPMAQKVLTDMQTRIDNAASVTNAERYWALIASISIAGGSIAKHLGLHDITIRPVFDFAVKLIHMSRSRSRDYQLENDDFLGSFLDRHFHEILVINNEKDKRTGLYNKELKLPRGPLIVRYEPDTKLLYILARSYREDCAKTQTNYDQSLAAYRKSGVFVSFKKKRMTSGTVANTQAPVNTLCFNTEKLKSFNETAFIQPDPDAE